MSADRHESPEGGRVIAGSYRLTRRIGEGGMGQVWEAQDLELDRRVAIKLMGSAGGMRAVHTARFQREARALARFKSPHVVTIYGVGAEGDIPFIVMELLEGEPLDKVLQRRSHLSLAEARDVFAPTLEALRDAHAIGIVHRDIKPSNIFLARTGEGVTVKVLDFGIAKLDKGSAPDITVTGAVVGTPRFMSPEQARGLSSVDHRSDLWSIGVVIYEALTGVPPFDASSTMSLAFALLTEQALSPSKFTELGASVDAFFARALAKAPEERFSSAAEMREALLALTASDPQPVDLRALLQVRESEKAPAPRAEVLELVPAPAPRAFETAGSGLMGSKARTKLSDASGASFGPSTTAAPARAPVRSSPEFELWHDLTTGADEQFRSAPGAAMPEAPGGDLLRVLPAGLLPYQDPIDGFLRALFRRREPHAANIAQLFEPSFAAAGHLRFFAIFLTGSDERGLLATRTFIDHTGALKAHLETLDAKERKVVLAISDSQELGAGVRQQIFALNRDHGAWVVPLHVARLRVALAEDKAIAVLHEALSDFNALPDPFAVGARLIDPTNLFGMRALVSELLRALEKPALVSVFGPPGCGKTSLVEMTRGELVGAVLKAVRCVDLAAPSAGTAARAIARALGDEGPEDLATDARLARLGPPQAARAGPKLILVLEDADVLLKLLEADDEPTRVEAQSLWKALGKAASEDRFSTIVTSLSGFILSEPKIRGWVNPLGNRVQLLPIAPLSLPDVRKLLTDLGLQINVRFDPAAITGVYEATAGNVYAVRKLAGQVVRERRRGAEGGPLAELKVRARHVKEAARDLAAIGETFGSSVLPWLDEAEKLVLEAVAARRPRDARGCAEALPELTPETVAHALDRLRRIGLIERRGDRERVAIPLLEAWSQKNLRPAESEAQRRQAKKLRTLAVGLSISLVLVAGYARWSSQQETPPWESQGCRYFIAYPRRAVPSTPLELLVYRTCPGKVEAPGADEVRLRAEAGTFAELGAEKGPEFVLHSAGQPGFQQRSVPVSFKDSGRRSFKLDVLVEDKTATTLTLDYDWLAGLSEATRRLLAAASLIPAALSALLAYGGEIRSLVQRMFGRGAP